MIHTCRTDFADRSDIDLHYEFIRRAAYRRV